MKTMVKQNEAPILCFVGRSNSGKTTVIERLIPELVREGYRLATIKHAGHGFNMDTEGKDSWRHKQAGAQTVIVTSKGSLALFTDTEQEVGIEQLRERYVSDGIDLIIAEGWKSEGHPKIVIVRDHVGEVPFSPDGLLAIVSNKPLQDVPSGVPIFDPDDIEGLAALISGRFTRKSGLIT
jgi:molybdopterin-guanine dinucleotide biosynthesis adapter protein